MILRRYGSAYHSVDPAFEPAALTEISFRRNHKFSVPVAEFDQSHDLIGDREISAGAEAPVQHLAEIELLIRLRMGLLGEDKKLEDGQFLVILNDKSDWPKTRERRMVVTDGEDNPRYRFRRWMEPPLKVGVYERRED